MRPAAPSRTPAANLLQTLSCHDDGVMPYYQLGDDKSTPAIEITNQKLVDLIKSKFEKK